MKKRNPIAVFFLTIITFGIYGIVWFVKTKNEMNKQGASIPTAWLLIIPLVNIYWLWKYSEGVDKVTNGKLSGVLAFILLWLLNSIGMAIVQNELNSSVEAPLMNDVGPEVAAAVAAEQSSADSSFGGPITTEAPATPVAPAAGAPIADVTPPAPSEPATSENPTDTTVASAEPEAPAVSESAPETPSESSENEENPQNPTTPPAAV